MKLKHYLNGAGTFASLLCLVHVADANQSPISLDEAAARITVESQGAIGLNSQATQTPVDPHSLPVKAPWHFEFKTDLVLIPTRVLQAEYVESLFKLDPLKFIELQSTGNFLDAKEKYYRRLRYDFSNKRYLLTQTTLSDWSGLNHPPIQQITEKDLSWINLVPTSATKTPAPTPTKESQRSTAKFHLAMDKLSDSELTAGNSFSPFVDQGVVPALLEIITSARKTLWGSALLFVCDESTKAIVAALEDRADHGVDVRLMLDRTLQSMQKGRCQDELRDHGIKVILVPGMLSKGSAFHVKLWVSDFKNGLFLGANLMNIQTEATGFNHLFHDSGMTVHGPIVTDMAHKFQQLWRTYSPEFTQSDRLANEEIENFQISEQANGLRGPANYDRWFGPNQTQGLCRVVTQERHQVRDRVSRVLGEYLKTAQNRIWFTSVRRDFHGVKEHPEIGYNELLLGVLEKARAEGVHVEMIFNAATNPYSLYSVADTGLPAPKKNLMFRLMKWHLNRSTNSALRDGADFLEKAHAEAPLFRAWSYFDYSHMKNLLIDDDFVLTGSYNPMDERSTSDAEIAVFCQDQGLSKNYSLTFARDLVNSIPYPYASQMFNN